MSERRVPGWVRALARVCLVAYSRGFQRERAAEYLDAASHCWRRERAHHGAAGAALRTVRVLVFDTLRAAPATWRVPRARDASLHVPRRAARERFGWLRGLVSETRLAVRVLARRPGFALLVSCTLGLGIGASTALFGALDHVALHPLPYPNGDRMVYLSMRHEQRGWRFTPPVALIELWRARAHTLERIEGWYPGQSVWQGPQGARLIRVVSVTPGLPDMLRLRPLLGRSPSVQESAPGAPPLALLSEGFWRSAFGGSADVVGRTLTLDDTAFTVAGVWPAAARLEPKSAANVIRVLPAGTRGAAAEFGYMLGLVRRGAAGEQVRSELSALTQTAGTGINLPDGVVPDVLAPAGFLGKVYQQSIWIVFGGGILLLLVAVLDSTNLLSGRAITRDAEFGVRLALGGSSGALLRLFLLESSILTLAGLLIALLVARAGRVWLAAVQPRGMTPLQGDALGPRALGWAAALAVFAALCCAIVPALRVRAAAVPQLLRTSSARAGEAAQRARAVIVALQVGLAILLLSGAALTLRSFHRLSHIDTGVAVSELVEFSVQLPQPRYPSDAARLAFNDDLVRRLGRLPGVRAVSMAGSPLMRFSGGPVPGFDGQPNDNAAAFASSINVLPGYLAAVGTSLLAGHDFDRATPHEMIVNSAFARAHGGDVVGHTLQFAGDSIVHRIVGVAGNVRSYGLDDRDDRIQLYSADFGLPAGAWQRFVVRTSGPTRELPHQIGSAVAAIDSNLPLRDASSATDLVRENDRQPALPRTAARRGRRRRAAPRPDRSVWRGRAQCEPPHA